MAEDPFMCSRFSSMLCRAVDARLRDEFGVFPVGLRALIGRHGSKTYDSGKLAQFSWEGGPQKGETAPRAPGW